MSTSFATRPAPVDNDPDGALRDAAVEEHADNLWAHEMLQQDGARFRDWKLEVEAGDHVSWDSTGTSDDWAGMDASGIAIYHLAGWLDIYATQQPMAFANLPNATQKMMIGPWIHSGGYGGSVHKAEFLRWYDHWMKGIDTGVLDEAPVHYYVMQGNHTLPNDAEVSLSLDEERAEDPATWLASDSWPPPGLETRRFSLAADGVLAAGDGGAAGQDNYTVDYSSSVGSFSRWMNGHGARRQDREGTTFLDERSAENERALSYTTEPLTEDLTVVGHPIVHLTVTSTHDDGDFFVYLEEVDSDGSSHYVTEGALRASYRAVDEAPWNDLGLPFHRGRTEDVEPLPGEPAELAIDLMATAITFDEGHRLRLTIAGADAANHELYPDPTGASAPTVTIHRGGEDGSWLSLPVAQPQ